MRNFLHWFKDSSKMKRWIMLILVGVVFTSYGMGSLIVSKESISLIQAIKIVIYFVICFTCVVLGLIFINKRTMELFVEATDDRIDTGKKVNVNKLIFNKKIYNQGPKIVVIGGGSGLNTTLEGLKKHTSNITAVVTISDYGENFKQNNEVMFYRQLEDIKNGMASLAISDESKMQELLNYKFTSGDLKGLAFSDVYFAAMNDISLNTAEAIKNTNDIFKICGNVLPVTKDKMKICAELDNGYLVEEKSKIAETVYDKITKINRVYLSPGNCKALPEVLEAIKEADGIIIGPGSLYTNVIPNLLVNGIARAIKEAKGVKLYVCNIMTEPGLTDNYSVSDHINAIIDHCGEGLIDYCLYDTGEVIPEYIKKYNLDGADLVEQDLRNVKDRRIKFIKENLSLIKDDSVRHNANLIADIVIQVICDDLKYMDKQNDPEYMMMNSKLKADKAINRKKRKASKEKTSGKKREKVGNSKFATKYQERIKSIKDSSKSVEKRRKGAQSKAKQQKITNTDDIDILKEQEKYAQENQTPVYSEVLKIKNYEEIRKEMLKKFNKSKS